MSKKSKACDITPRVRHIVYQRDSKRCILCGTNYPIEVAHYIPRSQCGLGIEQNLVCLCKNCHDKYDNGGKREEHGEDIRGYLKAYYKNWDEKDLVYNKYRWLDEVSGTTED